MPWYRYRTIRSRLTIGFVVLELLFTFCFAALILRTELGEIHTRANRRLDQQVSLLSAIATDAIADNQPHQLQALMEAMSRSTAVSFLRFTDPAGRSLVEPSESVRATQLNPIEQEMLNRAPLRAQVFRNVGGDREAIGPVRNGSTLLGYAWVAENRHPEQQEIRDLLRVAILAALLGAVGCLFVSAWLARSITRPLHLVMDATRRLIRDPETKQGFPLEVSETNEAGELAEAFNLLVLSMEEQRSGLNDTLALLDSMLAHAPIGFAFLDRQRRFIRVNQFLSSGLGVPLTRFLGSMPDDLFDPPEAERLHGQLARVFDGAYAEPLELQVEDGDGKPRSWVVSMYPVKSGQQEIRWAGAVLIDTTERRRSEDALRRTEKLAAAGQLAASIAHEINNPLEAVTNLLFLLKAQPDLNEDAERFTDMAQHELARVSEITQQTLRFYRPSTLPAQANLGELLDSILTLHSGRVHTLRVTVERRYGKNIEIHCLAGALRQVFANLVTNALDALGSSGGRLLVRARRSHAWQDGRSGVRVVVADTGCGMPEAVQRRIFEPFFTTKMATGTGLGLWVTQDIMNKHHGLIRARSRSATPVVDGVGTARTGTVFMLFFPDDGVEPVAAHETAKPVEAAAVS